MEEIETLRRDIAVLKNTLMLRQLVVVACDRLFVDIDVWKVNEFDDTFKRMHTPTVWDVHVAYQLNKGTTYFERRYSKDYLPLACEDAEKYEALLARLVPGDASFPRKSKVFVDVAEGNTLAHDFGDVSEEVLRQAARGSTAPTILDALVTMVIELKPEGLGLLECRR